MNVALPAIRGDLDAGLAAQQWVVEAYLLTLASLILIGGSLSDLFGRRRVFALGTALFGVTSLMCAVAPTAELLIAARIVQGAAGALLVPSTLATIMAVFPEEERGRAIGTWTAWSGISTVIGPLAGGVLVDTASWRWVFALELIPIAVTLYLVLRKLPACMDARAERRPHVDWAGRGAVRARPRRPGVRADPAAVPRLGRPAGRLAARSVVSCCSACSCWHEHRSPVADAAAGRSSAAATSRSATSPRC